MVSGTKCTSGLMLSTRSICAAFVLCCTILTAAETKPRHQAGLIHITNENWQVVLKRYPLLMVLFHSSHCSTSVKLKDELKDFRKLLHFQNSKVELAELDVFHFEPIMRQMGFPDFSQGKTAIPFVGFFFDSKPHLLKKKNPELKDVRKFMRDVYFSKHFTILKDENSLKVALQKQELTLIFNGQHDHSNFHGLIDWSLSRSKLNVSVVVYSTRGAADSTLPLTWNHAALYRRTDSSFTAFSRKEYDIRHIEEWIYIHSHPPVSRIDKAGHSRLVSDGNPALVLFAKDSEQEVFLRIKHSLDTFAETHVDKLLFLVCNLKVDSECSRLMALCQLEDSDLPILEVVHIPDHNHAPDFVLQYRMGPPLEVHTLDGLVEGFLSLKIDPWVKSEPAEDDANTSHHSRVTKLVGSTISAALKHSNRKGADLLILFHEGQDTEASQKALVAFTTVAAYLPSTHFSLATYNHNKNTRIGLSLTPSHGTVVRLYRQHEHSHYTDRSLGSSPRTVDILEFAVDTATADLLLPELEHVHWQ